jgi:putative Mg2+ transporter-C (MgtC) family protein
MDWLGELRILPDVLYAMALGGAIGYERELKNRPAGFRTHMLVAGTAALLLGLSRMVLEDAHYAGNGLQIDPLRLVEAVVAGISFIGAGTIFASRGGRGVEGITTAASLLAVASIGITVGFRYYVLALAITMLTLMVLTVLRWVEGRKPGAGEGGAEAGRAG